MPWKHDAIEVQSTPLTTTGGHVWKAAHILFEYFEEVSDIIHLNSPGVKVLELGAGCGWLGMSVACNLPHLDLVCLTEQETGGGLQWLQHNIDINKQQNHLPKNVIALPCDWTQYADSDAAVPASDEPKFNQQLESIHWDFIIGSDLIYNEVGATCLPKAMKYLAREHTQIYYCHTKHRYDLLDAMFFQELERNGLKCREVHAPSVASPPASPPATFPPVDLFPEQRICIYHITLGQH